MDVRIFRQFNTIPPGRGGEGGLKVSALTSNFNNFAFNIIEANATKLKFSWQQFGMAFLGPRNVTFPWQPYFDRYEIRNFDFLVSEFSHFLCNFIVF